jgi:2-methylcitrate dehydratase PrpD
MLNLGRFVVEAAPPADARAAAARAFLDTIGVTLAGACEPAGRIVQQVIAADGAGPCHVLGASLSASATNAALANGTAAHAHDYDDMCFVSLAHPSAPLVAAALAAGELAHAAGARLLDAYIVGFEIEGRVGRAMNPRHYQRGWHCTSTLGTIGAAAAASRLLDLTATQTDHALAIAASEASGLKENFGSMVKPLHAGLAARNGVLAADLAHAGMTASLSAIDGPQGFLAAMDSASPSLGDLIADLGSRWEIVDTGITVKLYPSCAATHPSLDAILDLRRLETFTADDVASVDVGVDPITPTVLLYERPSSPLEGKFSMPFCAAAAVVDGYVGLDTFDEAKLRDPKILAMQSRVTMRVDETLDASAPPLTQARVTVALRDGRSLSASANGARGYPERPATDAELEAKFLSCAARVMPQSRAQRALAAVREIARASDVHALLCDLACRPSGLPGGPR